MSISILQYLEQHGFLTMDQSRIIQEEAIQTKRQIEDLLIDMNFITSNALMIMIGSKDHLDTVDIKHTLIKTELARKLSNEYCKKNQILPYQQNDNIIYIAIAHQIDLHIKDYLKQIFPNQHLVYLLANQHELLEAIDNVFTDSRNITHWMKLLDHQYSIDESFAIRILSDLLTECIKKRASDIHFEPEEFFVRIRLRIDGVLNPLCIIPKDKWKNLCVRIKILANMDISHTLSSQDGHFSIKIFGKTVDLRISTHPVVYGENTVIRILDKQKSLSTLESLGYTSQDMSELNSIMKQTHGIFIVTGPTGSGKSTLMCSMLLKMNKPEISITTIEDPVEYSIPFFRQTDLQQYKQMSIASAARSILRQDPDIISISEIRDDETASIAMRAAMTGRLVLTTLHTSDVFSVFDRLNDMGISKNLLISHLTGIVNQRLIRKICEHCKQICKTTDEEKKKLSTAISSSVNDSHCNQICKAVGCEKCHYTGYLGRIAIAQILPMTSEIKEILLQNNVNIAEKILYEQKHVKTLADAMKDQILQLNTTIEEVNRVHYI